MKKPLLLLSFLLMNVSFLLAQKSVLVSDSTYFDYNSKLNNQPYEWEQHIYNAGCNDSVYQINYPASPANSIGFINTYSSNGNLYQQINQNFDTTTQSFVNKNRTTYTYDATNKPLMQTVENWNGSGWSAGGIGKHYYNAMGKDTLYLYQTWDATEQVYVNNSETLNSYDASGRNTSYLQQNWNVAASMWEPEFGLNYAFDANGYETFFSISDIDFFTNEYKIAFQEVYYVNNKGLVDSSYLTQNFFFSSDSVRYYYTYYPASSATRQSIVYNYSGSSQGNIFTGGNISTFFYDTVGNMRIDSTIYKSFITTPDSLSTGGSVRLAYHDSINYVVTDSVVTKGFVNTPDTSSITSTELRQSEYNEFDQPIKYFDRDSSYTTPYTGFREDDYHYIICSSSVLPVTLLNFTGSQKNNDALLQWQTTNETNTSYFSVQRSIDGVHFTNIGKVMAAGNSSTLKDYSYTDANITLLNTNKLFYRLAEQDNNGNITYSKTAELLINGSKLFVSVSPNPVQNTIVIYSPVSIANAVIKVTNMNGVVLYSSQQNLTAGDKISIDASRLSKGMYLVTVQSQTDKQVFKIVK